MSAVGRYRPGRGPELAQRAPCLYPGCRRMVDCWSRRGGRPRLFCSDDCRANFANIKKQLDRLMADLQDELASIDLSDERRELVEDYLAVAEWNALRFRSIRADSAK